MTKIKVFIENEANSNQKNLYNEKTLEYRKTVTVSREYPYPYGFILNTTSGDGDNADCFVITDKKLKTGEIVECEVVDLMEQIEATIDADGNEVREDDHNVLAVLDGEEIDVNDHVKNNLKDFVAHVFDYLPHKKIKVGKFLGKDEARAFILKCNDDNADE